MSKLHDRLTNLYKMYFRPVISFPEGHLIHYGDCSIYSEDYHCCCGLLQCLEGIPASIAEKIHPDYWKELGGSISEEEREKCRQLLYETFGEFIGQSEIERQENCNKEWLIIEEVFGELFRQRKESEWLIRDAEAS